MDFFDNDPLQTPTVNGISLVATNILPDRFRQVFAFPLFNAVQSKCYPHIYNNDDNFVLSAPTGSGKTVVFELAIIRLLSILHEGSFKIVYQAPTRALCSERQRDWHTKFSILGLTVAELTGDTENVQLRNVQHADIIITTPEKWDSISRKWKDHKKLMHMVKLFLIDEIHTLKEDRGAVLEVVVSRMKSIGSGVRFVAVSATIPNIQDICKWLGRNQESTTPAGCQTFGEEFRPVRTIKHVLGYQCRTNDFAFDRSLNDKLPEVIQRHSQGKPIMIFCFTRASCVETARSLAKLPNRADVACDDQNLNQVIKSGIAFHHGGLSTKDRALVERLYLSGSINIICCTSTLAAGVNLPCHLIIIKNTVTYTHGSSCKEYSDLEIMQMLGRAGRPQFGSTAIAVIMTKQQHVSHYERLVSGQEMIESRLHINLIDHLNAEIGLGTITDIDTAIQWMYSTFLCVRLEQNPSHYKISSRVSHNLAEHFNTICTKGIECLQNHDLVTNTELVRTTAFGEAMSRYCVQFETMKVLLSLARGAKIPEILSAIAKAAEFKEIYFRSGEKTIYRQWDKNPLIKFPLGIHVDVSWHKVYLIIQVVLAGNELSEAQRDKHDFNTAKKVVLQHAVRLTRCVAECMEHSKDSIGLRNALTLIRSLSAHIWDDSTLHISQLDGLGIAGVRRLVKAGIRSMEDLAITEAHRLEQIMTRNPPYGTELRAKATAFPRLTLDLSLQTVKERCVTIQVSISHLNDLAPTTYHKKPLQICLLLDTPVGALLHVQRSSASQMFRESPLIIQIMLQEWTDSIRAQVMCDELAGTARSSALRLQIPKWTIDNFTDITLEDEDFLMVDSSSSIQHVNWFDSSHATTDVIDLSDAVPAKGVKRGAQDIEYPSADNTHSTPRSMKCSRKGLKDSHTKNHATKQIKSKVSDCTASKYGSRRALEDISNQAITKPTGGVSNTGQAVEAATYQLQTSPNDATINLISTTTNNVRSLEEDKDIVRRFLGDELFNFID